MRSSSIDRARRDVGFTLVEILIAIVLIGVLGAVVAVGIGRLTDQAADATCTASADAARTAVNTFYVRNGAYPTSIVDLTTARPGTEADLQPPAASTVAGTTLATKNWTLTMSATTPPTFTCTSGSPVTTRVQVPMTTTTVPVPTTTTTTVAGQNGVAVSVRANYTRPYLGESIVTVTNPTAITEMTVTIRIAQTPGVAFHGQYSSFPDTEIAASYTTADGFITYVFTLLPGQTIDPDTWMFDAQTDGTDTIHATSGDSWTVSTTSGGIASTVTGAF